MASYAERNDRARNRSHLLAEAGGTDAEAPTAGVLRQEEQEFVAAALAHLSAADRDLLLAHEVDGDDTRTMADQLGSTPGAVAARLNRARAGLRVEYLLAAEGVEPPTDRCRPVLRSLSTGDRRRQRERTPTSTSSSARPAHSSPTGSSSAAGAPLRRMAWCGCRCPGTPTS